MSVSVIIPTFRRPEGLRAALESVLMQTRAPEELIVVDNAPEGCAQAIVRNVAAVARFKVSYVAEPRAGVSNARNAGLAAAQTRYIAFLDDDEIAFPSWLESLMKTAESQEADVVFGPLKGETPSAGGLRGALARRLYSRVGSDQDTMLDAPFGCGNSLVDLKSFNLPEQAFDPALNETGGEDDVFFAMLTDQGASYAWSARARAVETVPPHRTSWRHLLARSFAFGQGPTQTCARAERPDWAGVAFWMGVGAAQLAVFAPLAGLATLFRAPQAAALIDRAVQAAGKLIWFGEFEPRFYGSAATSDQA